MHHLWGAVLLQQVFPPVPASRFGEPWDPRHIAAFAELIARHRDELATVILEPIVQSAGGMRFYCAHYLREVRALCDHHGVLLIADEIATGFGRTETLFVCEQARISPDMMTVGKALTGGYLTLAAAIASERVADGIAAGDPGTFMHGPTALIIISPTLFSLGVAAPLQNMLLRAQTHMGRPALGGFVIKVRPDLHGQPGGECEHRTAVCE